MTEGFDFQTKGTEVFLDSAITESHRWIQNGGLFSAPTHFDTGDLEVVKCLIKALSMTN